MEIQTQYYNNYAGRLGGPRDGNGGVSAAPAPQRLRARSINTGIAAAAHSNSLSLGPTGSRPQDQNARALQAEVSVNQLTLPEVTLNGLVRPRPTRPTKLKGKKICVRIRSLNTRGKRDSNRKSKYKDLTTLIRKQRILVLGIQETKLREDEHLEIMQQNPKIWIESNPDDESKGGTGFIINKELLSWSNTDQPLWNHSILIKGRASHLTIEWNEQRLDIINVYVPNTLPEKLDFLNELLLKLNDIEDLHEPIIMGDFNFVEEAIDRVPHHNDKNHIIELWKRIENKYNLCDGWRQTHPEEKNYTFHQSNQRGISMSRIDRIYVNEESMEFTQNWNITPSAQLSDHQLMTVSIMRKGLPYIGKGLWKLHPDMIDYSSFTNRARKLLLETVTEMKDSLKNGSKVGNIWERKKKTLQKIGMEETTQRKRGMDGGRFQTNQELQKALRITNGELCKGHEARELMLELEAIESQNIHSTQLSSKARYRKEGERNTMFFFQLNKGKQNPSIITALRDKDGRLTNITSEMRQIASQHHEQLQAKPERTPEDITHIDTFLNQIDINLTEEEKEKMKATTTEEEVKNALRNAGNGVAAGFDGLPYEFYKYWMTKHEEYENLIKEGTKVPRKEIPNILWILTTVFNEIEETGLEDPNFVLGAMHLLYKKKDKTLVENYRPITLTNADYKTYTKTIATKLGMIAHNIIHPNQAGFIPGRGIYDHTRLSEAMISYCDNFEENGVIVALDQEKVYDKIAHDYLWKVLEKFQFPQKFIFRVQQLYKNARTVVMVNGTLGTGIDIKRGVRQGCPMSCLLYNIAIEPLAISLRQSNLNGFKIKGLVDRILASLFADDTLVYLKENDNLNMLRQIIRDFCQASTAKFNLSKTEYLPIGTKRYRQQVIATRKINNNPRGEIEDNVNIIKEGESLRTLGAWVGNGNNQNTQWETILKKQKQIMSAWQSMNLSFRGKELILKALVQSRALFLATVNGMPKPIQERMEKEMKNFLWNGRKATMIWEDATQPRTQGGLSIPDIKARMEAINIMWLQKYVSPRNEKPDWAFVVNQIVSQNSQKHPEIKKFNKISWIAQSWNESGAKNTKLPVFAQNMLATGRKYNVGYDALHTTPY